MYAANSMLPPKPWPGQNLALTVLNVPNSLDSGAQIEACVGTVQGYLAHKKTPTPPGPPLDPRHRPTVGS